ncbi:MAG: hypothetical protein PHR77_10470 [Kiritimatiellae bacterium]|nr:hypothetical protein [Kiritimatiellia bacterium]MDD5522741.1 hypothetical protein [Kiritimatiellia bacterium]
MNSDLRNKSRMHRRDFLKTGVQAAAMGVALSAPKALAMGSARPVDTSRIPTILKSYTAEDHRRRLQNIASCTREIHNCMRKHLVTNYLPGQCCYNLGEYPCRKPWDADEYDERELDRLKEEGIQLIQVMDEWNDRLRLYGGHKLTALNPSGFRRFVKMVHKRGMKILAYASSGYFGHSDPDFREEWSRPGDGFYGGYWDLTRCSPASPSWRAYLLPRMMRIIDEFELDGLYNDWGYVPNARKKQQTLAKDEVPAFEETAQYDGAMSDLLQLIYAEVTRRGGIYKVHADSANQPQTGGVKVYDYLWVGEGLGNADGLREAVKNHTPYVVPCIDMSKAKVGDGDEQYLHSIPYMQFPLFHAGRPFTGERATIPCAKYDAAKDGYLKRCSKIWEHYQANPNGPYTYTWWDFFPGRAETRPTYARWLKQYMSLVEEGTWAWLEIGDSNLFNAPLPKGVVVSAFANRELYLVLANYSQVPVELETTASYIPADQSSAGAMKRWSIPARSLKILRRSA